MPEETIITTQIVTETVTGPSADTLVSSAPEVSTVTTPGGDVIVTDSGIVSVVESASVVENTQVVAGMTVLETLYVGAQGLQGPPGTAGARDYTYPAGAILSGHRAVYLDASDQLYTLDPTSAAHAHRALGITTGAAAAQAPCIVRGEGTLTEPSWNWAPFQPIFAGPGGALTQTPPTSGYLVQLGVATSPTTMLVRIDKPIFLN